MKRTRTLKAWGVIRAGHLKNWWGGEESGIAVIRSKKEAEEFAKNKGCLVVPVDISYTIPF